MVFQSKHEVAELCFKKFKKNDLYALVFVILFMSLEISIFFHNHDQISAQIIYTLVCTILLFFFLRFIYSGGILINKMVDKIEIMADNICLQTFQSSILFNLIKKRPVTINIPRYQLQLELSNLKYGFKKKYTGNIYLLSYRGNQYLLSEGFFDDFEKLKNEF